MKRRRKRKSIINVPVASMGDIAFLLIIFFMVASHLARERHNINPPVTLDAIKLRNTQVSVAIDADGSIYLQGRQVRSAEDIEMGVRILLDKRTSVVERTVLFRCDSDIKRATFEPVIEGIAKGGGIIGAVGEKGNPDLRKPSVDPQ